MTYARIARLIGAIAALLWGMASAPVLAAPACTTSVPATLNAGPFSPAAVNGGKVPIVPGAAGITCDTSFIVLIGGNYLRGTLSSLNNGKLKKGGQLIGYTAYADSGATVPLTPGVTVDYMQNNLLNVLGLLGGSSAALPLYIKVPSGPIPSIGTYSDTITITWDWKLCKGVYALGNCVGTLDTGTGSSVVTVNLNVAAQDMTIALSSITTWDSVNGTGRPLALPGSKGRTSLVVRNPDLVALDDGSIAVIYKVPAKTSIALDGDGTTSPTVIGFTDGSPASGAALTYAAPGSTSDDVDFSADNGGSWTYAPTAGNRASEAQITQVRFRPRGAMKAASSFTLTFPFLVR